jgi:hypothetical protein
MLNWDSTLQIIITYIAVQGIQIFGLREIWVFFMEISGHVNVTLLRLNIFVIT